MMLSLFFLLLPFLLFLSLLLLLLLLFLFLLSLLFLLLLLLSLSLPPPSLFLKNIKNCEKIEIKKKNIKIIKQNIKHKKTIQSYDNQVKESDSDFVIPLNIDKNIDELYKSIKDYRKNIKIYLINNYFLIDNNKNNFIYQLINDELYFLYL